MAHRVTVSVDGQSAAADDLRALHQWLIGAEELRGRVRIVERPPEADQLGPVAEVLLVLQPPLIVLASAVVAWVRSRRSTVDVTITDADGSARTVSARQVRQLTPDEVGSLVTQLTSELAAGDQTERKVEPAPRAAVEPSTRGGEGDEAP